MEEGDYKRAKVFVAGILKKFPFLPNEEIAEIGGISLETVVKIRTEIETKSKNKRPPRSKA